MSATETGVPDLLRRFAPTPHYARVSIGGVDVELQTDDVEIVAEMQSQSRPVSDSISQMSVRAKIIRDHGAPLEDSDVTILSAAPLITLLVGTGTVLVLDCPRREILGFLAQSISAECFLDKLLPTLLIRMKDVGANPLSE